MYPTLTTQSLILYRERPINITIGPDNAIFCKVEDPSGVIIFSEFKPCRIKLDKVQTRHQGVWRLHIITPGHMIAFEHELLVFVKDLGELFYLYSKISKNIWKLKRSILTVECPNKYVLNIK